MAFGNRLTRWIYNHSPSSLRDLMATIYSRKRSALKFGPLFYETLLELERTQFHSKDRLHAMQEEKLASIAWYASRYSPFYKDLFKKENIELTDFNLSELTKLPIIEKSDVQLKTNLFRSDLYKKNQFVQHFQTSGTTGKPLDTYVDNDCLQIYKAHVWHHRSWAGVKLGDKSASFVGYQFVPLKRKAPPFWVHDQVENRLFFSLFHMNRDNLHYYAEALSKYQPDFIMGYPNAIYILAKYLLDYGNHNINPKAVFTGSETLFNYQRDVIESAFSCKTLDFYGSTEYACCAMQCEYGNYHIPSGYGIIEVLNKGGTKTQAGQEGEIISTGLINRAMPFLRYRIGDTAIPIEGECLCGRSGKLLKRITGRVDDIIVTPDGRFISRLDFIFKGVKGIVEAQLIQNDRATLNILVVPSNEYNVESKRHIMANLKDHLGQEMRFVIKSVDTIPRTSNGKFRYVISNLSLDQYSLRQTGRDNGS